MKNNKHKAFPEAPRESILRTKRSIYYEHVCETDHLGRNKQKSRENQPKKSGEEEGIKINSSIQTINDVSETQSKVNERGRRGWGARNKEVGGGAQACEQNGKHEDRRAQEGEQK